MVELSAGWLTLLFVISILAGIGITAIGPGGVLVTIALFAITNLSPAEVAGTSIVTHVGTGLAGTLAYRRMGQFSAGQAARVARILCASTVVGVPVGMWLNSLTGREGFGILLGLFSGTIGLLVWYRERRRRGEAPRHRDHTTSQASSWRVGLAGAFVAAISTFFGIGGPMMCVPCLVLIGLPLLPALAAAQVQSILIAGLGTIGYLSQGAIDWPLAVFLAIPQMVGVVIGARLARTLPARSLTYALAAILVALAPYLALVE